MLILQQPQVLSWSALAPDQLNDGTVLIIRPGRPAAILTSQGFLPIRTPGPGLDGVRAIRAGGILPILTSWGERNQVNQVHKHAVWLEITRQDILVLLQPILEVGYSNVGFFMSNHSLCTNLS